MSEPPRNRTAWILERQFGIAWYPQTWYTEGRKTSAEEKEFADSLIKPGKHYRIKRREAGSREWVVEREFVG